MYTPGNVGLPADPAVYLHFNFLLISHCSVRSRCYRYCSSLLCPLEALSSIVFIALEHYCPYWQRWLLNAVKTFFVKYIFTSFFVVFIQFCFQLVSSSFIHYIDFVVVLSSGKLQVTRPFLVLNGGFSLASWGCTALQKLFTFADLALPHFELWIPFGFSVRYCLMQSVWKKSIWKLLIGFLDSYS